MRLTGLVLLCLGVCSPAASITATFTCEYGERSRSDMEVSGGPGGHFWATERGCGLSLTETWLSATAAGALSGFLGPYSLSPHPAAGRITGLGAYFDLDPINMTAIGEFYALRLVSENPYISEYALRSFVSGTYSLSEWEYGRIVTLSLDPISQVPEPGTLALMTTGLGVIASRRLRAQPPRRTGTQS